MFCQERETSMRLMKKLSGPTCLLLVVEVCSLLIMKQYHYVNNSSSFVDPDLLIRTSGEFRLSNFMPWQLAYTELVFVNKFWPELTRDDLHQVLQIYSQRTRRYGT